MTQHNNAESAVDVNTIIAKIRADVSASELPIESSISDSAAQESDLQQILAEANCHVSVGNLRTRGVRGLLNPIILRILAPLVGEINQFNSLSVRTLNKLSKMLTGNDTATESDLLANTQRRIDLLTDLGKRIDSYDQLELNERLKRIEEQLATLQPQE